MKWIGENRANRKLQVQLATRLVLFSDLDGTFLDEFTYSYQDSLTAVKELKRHGVSVVFCSSKTRSEQLHIRRQIDVFDPFIVENGSAVIIPPNSLSSNEGNTNVDEGEMYDIVLGKTISQIAQILDSIKRKSLLKFATFLDVTDDRVAELTGLDIESAARARKREFSTPILADFNKSELDEFMVACKESDLYCVFGGRFLTVSGANSDKGAAITVLTNLYKAEKHEVITAAVGDSSNDTPMFENVDWPYLVQRSDRSWVYSPTTNAIKVAGVGPIGFSMVAADILLRMKEINS